MSFFAGGQGFSLPEPSLRTQFLPACRECGGVHPLARKPAAPEDRCPDCGAHQWKGAPVDVPAIITGRGLWPTLARACFAAARFLANLIERL